MSDLYKKAVLDAKKVKEMAEHTARQKIIENITPRIRRLIDQELMSEASDSDDSSFLDPINIDLEDEEAPDEEVTDLETVDDQLPGEPDMDLGLDVGLEAGIDDLPPLDDELSSGEKAPVNVNVSGDAHIHVESDEPDEDEDVLLSTEAAQKLVSMFFDTSGSDNNALLGRALQLEKFASRLSAVEKSPNKINRSKRRKIYCHLLKEGVSLWNNVILIEQKGDKDHLQKRIRNVLKEIKDMARSRRGDNSLMRLFESKKLNEMTEEEELDELDAVLSLTPDSDDEADEVEDLLADLEVALEITPPEEGEGDDEGAEEDFGSEDEEEGSDEELDFEFESDDLGLDEMDDDTVYEIDESMLAQELARLKNRSGRRNRRLSESDPVSGSGATSFGGGDPEEESFLDVNDDDLNVEEDTVGPAPKPTVSSESRRRKRRRSQSNLREAVATLQKRLGGYKKALKVVSSKLDEQNLFNAKLLHVNKLLRNRGFTPTQLRTVVEALDDARTLREVRLVMRSLASSDGKVSKSGKISEGARGRKNLGTASKTTRSSNPKINNSGFDPHRLQELAGIKKG